MIHAGQTAQPLLLGALVGQLFGVGIQPPARISEKRRMRMERALVLMLERGNVQLSRLAELVDVSDRTVRDDAVALQADGLVSTWIVKVGPVHTRWYGLTPAGAKRAKELKEMGDD